MALVSFHIAGVVLRTLSLTIICVGLGCTPDAQPSISESEVVTSAAIVTSDSVLGSKTRSQSHSTTAKRSSPRPALVNLTNATFSAEVQSLIACDMTSEVTLKRCGAYKRVQSILSDREAPAEHRRFLMNAVGHRLLNHKAPQVRWFSIRLLRTEAQVQASTRDALSERLSRETHPVVIASLLQTLGRFAAQSEQLLASFKGFVDHSMGSVRVAAVTGLSQIPTEQYPSVTELLRKKLESGVDKAVGEALCKQLARAPNERSFSELMAVVANFEHKSNALCFVALTSTWVAHRLKQPSERGFALTASELKRRLDAGILIPWSVIMRLSQGSHLVRLGTLSQEKLKTLRKILERLVYAKNQDIQVRAAAVQALSTYAAKVTVFEGIVKRYSQSETVEFQLAARARRYLPKMNTD